MKVLKNFGWNPGKISLEELCKIAKENKIPLHKIFVSVDYAFEYDENPDLILITE